MTSLALLCRIERCGNPRSKLLHRVSKILACYCSTYPCPIGYYVGDQLSEPHRTRSMDSLACRRPSCDLYGPERQWWITSLTLCFRLHSNRSGKRYLSATQISQSAWQKCLIVSSVIVVQNKRLGTPSIFWICTCADGQLTAHIDLENFGISITHTYSVMRRDVAVAKMAGWVTWMEGNLRDGCNKLISS